MSPRGNTQGFTLIEVVVAMLITAVMVSSVFSVSLHTRRNDVRADRKLLAAQATRQLTSTLEEYVTADHSSAQSVSFSPGGSWAWQAPVTDSAGGYALAAGTHTLTHYLPSWFEAAPYNAHAVYYVQVNSMGGSNNLWVSAAVTWAEP